MASIVDQNPTNMDYMLVHMLGAGQTESGQTVDRFFYVFPKRSSATDQRAIGVLGGTFVEGDFSKNIRCENQSFIP